jgi:hypothetical protein
MLIVNLQQIKSFVNEGGLFLPKLCKCGSRMNFRMRTVIYKHVLEIENVPIYTCDTCSRSEVLALIKSDLTTLISQFGHCPEKRLFYFNEASELADLIWTAAQKEHKHIPVDKILEERINQLLDILLLAQSLQDEAWIADVLHRLSQITKQNINTYDLT